MKKESITYKEIENRNNSKYYFYKGNTLIATVENDKLKEFIYLTKEERKEIKKIAGL